jgi:steroid delta-isomerase-like uncharacterized protein
MLTEENKALVWRYFDERWNHGNLDVCDELLPSTFDIESFKAWHRSMYASFGEMQMTNLGMIAEGDQVAIHWRVAAIHQGDYLGVPATGRSVTYQGIAWLRIIDGKVVDDTAYWDNLDILQQIGATTIPTSGTS